ncbi:hypothetical protein RGQ15_20140 [Paracoccus sp. MBLB3053]|uniref:Uncharacterized protein n=1 Tax=Paracoccus aurantius TaxID=3073814 RepID=A0ABU2HXU1_9RHOB|nr:hypothetical protein [Paracoccus sp. MBLB3053]MDS9469871.1 hypothetical protein [Paracoccus sp. MBLB3053]
MALEARSRGHIHRQDLLAGDVALVAHLATPPPCTAALAGFLFGGLLHAGGFERESRRQVLQPRNLVTQILVLGKGVRAISDLLILSHNSAI